MAQTLNEFLDFLFRDTSGIVYIPTKLPSTGFWQQNFFNWPAQRQEVNDFINEETKTKEVYIAPALYTERKISPDTFKGTFNVWAEFDGEIPTRLGDVPEPSLKIQSSLQGHEHWYWALSDFTTNPNTISEISKKITYALGADLSGWDYSQVLRPPQTVHHESQRVVSTLYQNNHVYILRDFDGIPSARIPKTTEIQVKDLPDYEFLIAKYNWKWDTWDLFSKDIPPGFGKEGRSGALTRLAFDTIEMGMTNDEILSILYNADNRWGKYRDREDQLKRLLGIVSYARSKIAEKALLSLDDKPIVYPLKEFLETEINLDWIIEDILPERGCGVIFGPPGVGKSTWALRMGLSIASPTDTKFLNWNLTDKPMKVMFLSLEMAHDELKFFLEDMQLPVSSLDRFLIMPVGHQYPLDTEQYQRELLQYIDVHQPNLVIIDSLGVAMAGKVTDDDDIKKLNAFLNEEFRKKRGIAYWFVHHPRKPTQNGPRKAEDLYDMFGSIYIAGNAQAVINLNKEQSYIKVNMYKTRLSQDAASFKVNLDRTRNFSLYQPPKTEKKEPKHAVQQPKSFLQFHGDSDS